jgi:hypothetical protein
MDNKIVSDQNFALDDLVLTSLTGVALLAEKSSFFNDSF